MPSTIASLRKRAGLTNEATAIRADIGLRHFYKIQAGEVNPRVTTAIRIARALGVKVEDILWSDGQR